MDVLLKRRLLCGGDRWLIAEIDARGIPGAQADRCLVCQSEQVMRRLWDYPTDWHSLSDEALGALCEGVLADMPAAHAGQEARAREGRPSASLDEARA